ncbi:methanogenesis marker 16 metalloprotein [Methanopyrus sp.]
MPTVVRIDEFWDMTEGERRSVDAVTCATVGLMSGVYGVLSFRVVEPGEVRRFEEVQLEGIRVPVGPCPNERLGLVECLVPATARGDVSGAHLLRTVAEGSEFEVIAVADDGREYEATIGPEELERAMIASTRTCFRNYSAIFNDGERPALTIFAPRPLEPGEASFSGCGGYNPLEHDPDLRLHRPGRYVLFCGAPGVITGEGTRSTRKRPNLTLHANLIECDPEFMGEYRTSAGPENIAGVASVIATTEETLPLLERDHSDAILPIVKLSDRAPIAETTYADVWVQEEVRWNPDRCENCDPCRLEENCPYPYGDLRTGDCFHCGYCREFCPAVEVDLGELEVEGRKLPIVARESSAYLAKKLMERAIEAAEEGKIEVLRP